MKVTNWNNGILAPVKQKQKRFHGVKMMGKSRNDGPGETRARKVSRGKNSGILRVKNLASKWILSSFKRQAVL